jgi:hypothetical protein
MNDDELVCVYTYAFSALLFEKSSGATITGWRR